MNQDFISQTPLDQITGTDYGQMLKAAIPYLPARSRQILSIYEKSNRISKYSFLFLGKKKLRIRSDCCKYHRHGSYGYA